MSHKTRPKTKVHHSNTDYKQVPRDFTSTGGISITHLNVKRYNEQSRMNNLTRNRVQKQQEERNLLLNQTNSSSPAVATMLPQQPSILQPLPFTPSSLSISTPISPHLSTDPTITRTNLNNQPITTLHQHLSPTSSQNDLQQQQMGVFDDNNDDNGDIG